MLGEKEKNERKKTSLKTHIYLKIIIIIVQMCLDAG